VSGVDIVGVAIDMDGDRSGCKTGPKIEKEKDCNF